MQLELCLAHLRTLNPRLRTWGLSATLGNLSEAMRVLARIGSLTPLFFPSFTGGADIEPQPRAELFAFAADRVWRLPR